VTRVLLSVSVLCLVAAAAIVAWPRPVTAAPTPAVTAPLDHDHAQTHDPALPTVLAPISGIASIPAATEDSAVLAGRPSTAALARQELLPALPLAALPMSGSAELLWRSTRGGAVNRTQFAADWQQDPDSRVTLWLRDPAAAADPRTTPSVVRVGLFDGRWELLDPVPPLPAAWKPRILDLARWIGSLGAAFVSASDAGAATAATLTLAGETWTRWRHDGDTLLLVAPDDAGEAPAAYPARDGAWNDLRIRRAADGRWLAVERLSVSPSTPDEPGSLVRRILLTWPAARAAGTAP
jgi:hypothetical protein